MTSRWISLGTGLFFLTLGSLEMYLSQKLPGGLGLNAAEPGPGLFPIIVGSVMFFAASVLLFENMRSDPAVDTVPNQIPRDIILMVLTIAMYIFLLPRAGFFVAAFLLLIGSLSIFDMPGWMQRIGTALVATLLSFAIFTLVLNVKMPNPSWFN
jgi:hypothetical protein